MNKTNVLLSINSLKNNDEDFEWYPTTDEMLDIIYNDLRTAKGSVLDIGCGDCRFFNYFAKKKNDEREEKESILNYNKEIDEIDNIIYSLKQSIHWKQEQILTITVGTEQYDKKYGAKLVDYGYGKTQIKYYAEDEFLKTGEEKRQEEINELQKELQNLEAKLQQLRYNQKEKLKELHNFNFEKYYVIEKAKTFINRFSKETILVGTDFYSTTLIDKDVDYIFCNPPYSDYENWVVKILKEGFCNVAYLIIPQRWKENKAIQDVLDNKKYKAEVIYSGDFLNAERQARAKIDIVKIDFRVLEKEVGGFRYSIKEKVKIDPFQSWFEEFFNVNAKKEHNDYDEKYREEKQKEKYFKEKIKNEIAKQRSISEILVELYSEEQNQLIMNYKNLSSLDSVLMEELNINLYSVMEGLQQKIKGLKNKYWNELFNKLDKITDRLTTYSRDLLLSTLRANTDIDFTEDNIYAVVLWVIKNANEYYDKQLVDLFFKLTKEENIKNYKSNQKTWQKEKWRYNSDNKEHTHYTLDYRLIMSCYDAGLNYGSFDSSKSILSDLIVIAKNLNFNVSNSYYIAQDGVKRNIYFYAENKSFIEYKAYKNGNLHLFLDKEFIKAFNIEVSRILGWIKDWSDIEKEFDCELKKEDVKYYKSQFSFNKITNDLNIKLLLS